MVFSKRLRDALRAARWGMCAWRSDAPQTVGNGMKILGRSCVVLAALMCGHTLDAATSCESLWALHLPNTSMTSVGMVPAGGFSLRESEASAQAFSDLPAFCRVAATVTPSSDSDIKVE